ncbi:uncharacterized protein LOC131928497 [Physella acuta]|uniref:uncharacterized protein LOC131928497 n=1 Tax=Physella acuta TaxID=109671 RepID=UPI0027DAF1AC|nr:uncharacterized protein LOC131928497 [Physella acuta]
MNLDHDDEEEEEDDDDDEDDDEEEEDESDDDYGVDLTRRTKGACQILLRQNPDVILLQEVVDHSLDILRREMTNYEIFVGSGEHIGITASYYTAILVNKNTVEVHTPGVVLFPTTRMKRNLLYFKGRVRGVPMTVMTSHMESLLDRSEERMNQIRIAFREMTNTAPDETVVFGGDLNVRDWEIGGDTSVPPGVLDLWEATGSRPETQYSWDLTINDNIRFPTGNQPRRRFDRMYVRHSATPALEPLYFRFIGTNRLPSCQRFASDHWGLLASFRVLRHGSAAPWRLTQDGGQASPSGQQEGGQARPFVVSIGQVGHAGISVSPQEDGPTSSRDQQESGQAGPRGQLDAGVPAQIHDRSEQIQIASWNIAGLDDCMSSDSSLSDGSDDDDDESDDSNEDEDDDDESDDDYEDDLTLRTKGACQILLRTNPDVILLQEVIDQSLDILRKEMTNYEIFVGTGEHVGITMVGIHFPPTIPSGYYTAILVNKETVEVHMPGVVVFPTSTQRRNLLYFKGRVRGVPMTVMTSHMESQLPCSDERKYQIRTAFREMTNTAPDETVVFGGDLNVRDWEIGGDTAIPPGVLDLWEATGSRPDTQYTWDLRFNDSLRMPGRNSPRKRFDRMYIRHSSPPAVETSYFRFIGTLRLPSCQRFASDHWGLLASFRVLRHGSAGPWRGLHDGGQASSRGQQEDSCQTSSRGQEESGQASSRSPQDDGQANSLGQQEDSGQASSRDRQEISQTRTFLISIGDQEVLDQPETQG